MWMRNTWKSSQLSPVQSTPQDESVQRENHRDSREAKQFSPQWLKPSPTLPATTLAEVSNWQPAKPIRRLASPVSHRWDERCRGSTCQNLRTHGAATWRWERWGAVGWSLMICSHGRWLWSMAMVNDGWFVMFAPRVVSEFGSRTLPQPTPKDEDADFLSQDLSLRMGLSFRDGVNSQQRICWVSISGAGEWWHENARPEKLEQSWNLAGTLETLPYNIATLEPWNLLLGCKAGLMLFQLTPSVSTQIPQLAKYEITCVCEFLHCSA